MKQNEIRLFKEAFTYRKKNITRHNRRLIYNSACRASSLGFVFDDIKKVVCFITYIENHGISDIIIKRFIKNYSFYLYNKRQFEKIKFRQEIKYIFLKKPLIFIQKCIKRLKTLANVK